MNIPDELDAVSKAQQEAAARLISEVANYLKMSGYQYVLISVARLERREERPGEVAAPGATILVADDECTPIFPHQADVLRGCVGAIEHRFAQSGVAGSTRSSAVPYVPPTHQGN